MENYFSLSEYANGWLAEAAFRRMKAPFEFRITCKDTPVGKLFYLHFDGETFGGRATPQALLSEYCERLVLKSQGIDYPK